MAFAEERPRPDEDLVRETLRDQQQADELDQASNAEGADAEPSGEDLEDDPAYNPDDPGLKDLKGG